MKAICLACLLCFGSYLFAQDEAPISKGASPISAVAPHQVPNSTNPTRAVIVGISNYSDERIPDLRFAHEDAKAFSTYLRSPAGGSLTNDQIIMLTNEKATAGKIIASISWLIEECKSGDRAIIYFSGHGDVEQVTKFQRGYLLAYDSPGTTYMAGGSLPVGFLSDVITTLSDTGVEVIMISDACRSGKLAGSANDGAQATTAALTQQFSKEIKILSCQPEEYSLEGEEWGGGRGCFSYHLIDALTGMADGNTDLSVNLLETGRYLEDKVPAETAPHSQMPMTIGNRNTILSSVQPEALTALIEERANKKKTISPIDPKGLEEVSLVNADSTIQELYAAFKAAIDKGDLMSPKGASANDYYSELINKPDLGKLKGLMTRNFSAALQDDAQVIINQFLRTDPAVVDDAFSRIAQYDHLPDYLNRASELLGKDHYLWRYIKAREYFFRAKTFRAENYPGLSADSLLTLKQATLDTALTYDEEASYVYFQKGYLGFWAMRANADHYLAYFEKASALSPGWLLPLYYLGRAMDFPLNDEITARVYLRKAIELDSLFLPAYWSMSNCYSGEESKYWNREYIRIMKDYEQESQGKTPLVYQTYYGSSLRFLGRYEEAKVVYEKAIEQANGKYPFLYNNLAIAYCALGQYEEAVKTGLIGAQMMPNMGDAWLYVVVYKMFFWKKELETVPQLCRHAIKNGSVHAYSALIVHYHREGKLDSALLVAKEWIANTPPNPQSIMRLGQTYWKMGDTTSARKTFEKLLDNEMEWNTKPAYYFRLAAELRMESVSAQQSKKLSESIKKFIAAEKIKSTKESDFLFWTACVLAECGRNSAALDYLAKAIDAGWKAGPIIRLEPTLFNYVFDDFRDTRKFKKLVKRYERGN